MTSDGAKKDSHGSGSVPGFPPRLLDCWHPVAYSHEVPAAAPLAATLLGEAVVIWRTADGTTRAFLRQHVAIHKLRANKPLTASDLGELERMLAASGLGATDDFRRAALESEGLGIFVRSLVGLDRGAAKEAMAGFIDGKVLSANQLEFINLVVNHLTEYGVMEPARLYESPFTDLTPLGPEGLFPSHDVDALVKVLHTVRSNAVAA